MTVPSELAADYFEALRRLGNIVGAVINEDWDQDFVAFALAALAVSKGFALIGEAIQELNDTTAESLLREIRG